VRFQLVDEILDLEPGRQIQLTAAAEHIRALDPQPA